jgi:hypothetical protein
MNMSWFMWVWALMAVLVVSGMLAVVGNGSDGVAVGAAQLDALGVRNARQSPQTFTRPPASRRPPRSPRPEPRDARA